MSSSVIPLDSAPRGLEHSIKNHADYAAHKIPTCEKRPEEPELKFLIPQSYSVQTVYADLYNLHNHQPNLDSPRIADHIFFADNKVVAREPLISFALDTKHFDIMRHAGEQLRVRGPIDMKAAKDPSSNVIDVVWRGQTTLKTLFSQAVSAGGDRVEIEPSVPSRDIRKAFAHFMKHDAAHVDPVYHEVNPDELYIPAICITPRASFNIHVYLPEHDAFVEFENCADPNYYLAPHGDVKAGRDLEFEAEAKMIYTQKDQQLSDDELKEIYQAAKAKYRDYILHAFPDFEESLYSKVERALRSVAGFYAENQKGDIPLISTFGFNSMQACEEIPYSEPEIRQGMMHAIRQKVTIDDAMETIHDTLATIENMAMPQNLIPANTNRGKVEFTGFDSADQPSSRKHLRIA